ncbi:MAG: hypothetical protein WCF57_13045 [Pyrinomonadaceae bacterium]
MKAVNLLLLLVLLLVGAPHKDGSAAAQGKNGWTNKPVERKKEGIAPITLRQVRAAEQDGFDRIVFEFKDNQVPGYRIEYVAKITDTAERVHKLFGKAFLRIDMNPAWAHSNETGAPSLAEREKRVNLSTIIEFKQVEDFEGVVSYALGLSRKKSFRVTEMSNPARLVIDIKH